MCETVEFVKNVVKYDDHIFKIIKILLHNIQLYGHLLLSGREGY